MARRREPDGGMILLGGILLGVGVGVMFGAGWGWIAIGSLILVAAFY